jgi:hypothetical protein
LLKSSPVKIKLAALNIAEFPEGGVFAKKKKY